jgi:hypothetical protein
VLTNDCSRRARPTEQGSVALPRCIHHGSTTTRRNALARASSSDRAWVSGVLCRQTRRASSERSRFAQPVGQRPDLNLETSRSRAQPYSVRAAPSWLRWARCRNQTPQQAATQRLPTAGERRRRGTGLRACSAIRGYPVKIADRDQLPSPLSSGLLRPRASSCAPAQFHKGQREGDGPLAMTGQKRSEAREANRMATCASDCWRQRFAICGRCDRGRRYCPPGCARTALREQLHRAGQQYQQSARGRSTHAIRQAGYPTGATSGSCDDSAGFGL